MRLLFEATDNVERGGAEAGEAMLAAGLPSTAVVAGTDYNAIGVMGVLKAAGLVLPRDQAIVGFDDTEAGALTTPALSSVRQDFNAIGAKAAQLVLELASRQEVPALHYRVPTRYVVRSSCGCAPGQPGRAGLERAHPRGPAPCVPGSLDRSEGRAKTRPERWRHTQPRWWPMSSRRRGET